MKSVFYLVVGLLFFLLLFSCSQHLTYIPSADAEIESGHFLLFYNELSSADLKKPETFEPTFIAVDIIQEGKSIFSGNVDDGNWDLYPVPEGVYLVKLEIEYNEQPVILKRSFTSRNKIINVLNVDVFQALQLKPDVQTEKATITGKAVAHVLDAKRENKPLTFYDIQRFDTNR